MPHRLYTNENFPRPAVERLRANGHDVVTMLEDGLANQSIPDVDVIVRATALHRTVVTLNKHDFIRLHQADQQHGGIVVCTTDVNHEALADRIHALIEPLPALNGHLMRVNRPAAVGQK